MINLDPEAMERFFKAYLEEHKLKFTLKKEVYTVHLDKTHEKWYDTKKLIGTFNSKIAKDKAIILFGVGTFIFDSMVSSSIVF